MICDSGMLIYIKRLIKMLENYFINEVIVKNRKETVVYEDWLSKTQFVEQCRKVPCRVSSLNYKDLQLISDTDNLWKNIRKLYTSANIDIDTKDIVEREGKNYQVIATYRPQDKYWVHHNKYFIKIVE